MLYCSHLFADIEMAEMIRHTHMGIESIAFSVADNLDHLEAVLFSYEKTLSGFGYPALILHGPFLDLSPVAFDRAIRRVTLLRYGQAYTAAKKLGAKKIVYHSCFIPKVYLLEGWAERMASFFEQFLADKDNSVEILMENVLDQDPHPLKEVAEKISHPAFGLCLDTGHAHCYAKTPLPVWAKMLGPDISHVHLHDNWGEKDSHLAAGAGNAPLEETLQTVLAKNPLATCTIECSNVQAAKASLDWLRNAFPQLLQ